MEQGADKNKENINDKVSYSIRDLYSKLSILKVKRKGCNPLSITCEKGHRDVVKYLVELGVNINKV